MLSRLNQGDKRANQLSLCQSDFQTFHRLYSRTSKEMDGTLDFDYFHSTQKLKDQLLVNSKKSLTHHNR